MYSNITKLFQVLYHSFFMMCYNVIFTSLPVLMYGLLEQNYSAKILLRSPQLYLLNRRNNLLSFRQFVIWFLTGKFILLIYEKYTGHYCAKFKFNFYKKF